MRRFLSVRVHVPRALTQTHARTLLTRARARAHTHTHTQSVQKGTGILYSVVTVAGLCNTRMQFSSLQSLGLFGRRKGMRDDSAENPVFSAGGHCEQFWHGQQCPLFDVVHPAFPLPTTASPTLQNAPKDWFGEAVVACDMQKPSKFRYLDKCLKEVPVDPLGN